MAQRKKTVDASEETPVTESVIEETTNQAYSLENDEPDKKDSENTGTLIYCGHDIKNVVSHGDTFINGKLPGRFTDIVAENPHINTLLVRQELVVKTMKAIKDDGSVENLAYKKTERIKTIYDKEQ